MGVNEVIASSVLSVALGIGVGVAVEAVSTMPLHARASASVEELVFELAVQTSVLAVVLSMLTPWETLQPTGAVPFGMAVAAAQPGLNSKLALLAAQVKKAADGALRQRVAQAPEAVTTTQ